MADNCLLCNRCVEACPVGIQTTLIRQIKRGEWKGTPPNDCYGYWPQAEQSRTTYDVAYFAGCMSHLGGGIIPAMQTIFRQSGDSYLFLDEEKNLCCGRPLRQQGYTTQADQMRDKLEKIINQSGAKKLVTSCPICYHAFQQEYHLEIPVQHHTEYIRQCLAEGKINVCRSKTRYAYHDPCELGRGEQIYEEPREILQAIGTLCKVPSEKKDALCCGHSLGNTALDSRQQNLIRDEALQTLCTDHPDILATACPLCKKAFLHGNRQLPVKDVAEIVAEQLQ